MSILVMFILSIILGTFMAHATTPFNKWPDYIGYMHWIHGAITGPITDLHVRIPDYYIIRELEYKLFGENFHHAGSPIPCNCENCNPSPMCVNGQLCKSPGTHTIRRHTPDMDRTWPKNREPLSRDRTLWVDSRTKYRKIPLSREPRNFDPAQRIIAAYGYGMSSLLRSAIDPWHDRDGE